MKKEFSLIVSVALFFIFLVPNTASATTKYLSIPGTAFMGGDRDDDYVRNAWLEPRGPFVSSWYAPVYLPDGAQIRGASLGVQICGNWQATSSIEVNLIRYDPTNNLTTVMRTMTLDQNSPCTLLSPVSPFFVTYTIDNGFYTYFVEVSGFDYAEFGENLNIRWVRIEYYLSAALIP